MFLIFVNRDGKHQLLGVCSLRARGGEVIVLHALTQH